MRLLSLVIILCFIQNLKAQEASKLSSFKEVELLRQDKLWLKNANDIVDKSIVRFLIDFDRTNYSFKGDLKIKRLTSNTFEVNTDQLEGENELYKKRFQDFISDRLSNNRSIEVMPVSEGIEFSYPIDFSTHVQPYEFIKAKGADTLRFAGKSPDYFVKRYFERTYRDSLAGKYTVTYMKTEMNGKKFRQRQHQDKFIEASR